MIERYLSPKQVQRLLSGFIVVCGAISLFALFAFIIFPGLRSANRPPRTPAVAPPQGEPGWLDPTEYPATRGYDVPPVDPDALLKPTPELLARGNKLFAENCAACHGTAGKGDGPAAQTLTPKPRNLTHASGWTDGNGLTAIFQTVAKGLPRTGMPAFGHLSPEDLMALSHSVMSLGTFPHDEDEDALEELRETLGSEGGRVPPKIPVKLAAEKLSQEYSQPQALDLPSEGLLARAIADPVRAARTLSGLEDWRTDFETFSKAVSAGAPGNGFSLETAALSESQWKSLHKQLIKRAPR